jgi:hypothetical protein
MPLESSKTVRIHRFYIYSSCVLSHSSTYTASLPTEQGQCLCLKCDIEYQEELQKHHFLLPNLPPI